MDSLVSVVIPTYYRNELLERAIDSVRRQEYQPIEIIVVDDSGEGHAEPIGSQLDGTYIRKQAKEGLTLARHAGVKAATGDYIKFLDDDDYLLSNAIERAAESLEQPDVGVTYTGYRLGADRIVLPLPDARGDVLEYALMFSLAPCVPSSMLIERSVLTDVDLERIHDCGLHNEHAMQIELAQRTAYDYIDEPLLVRNRSHDSRGESLNAAHEYRRTIEEYTDLYEQHPAFVRRTAMGYSHFIFGERQIQKRIFSPAAIRSFALAAYITPEMKLPYIGSLVAAFFGRPGYCLGRKVYKALFASSKHRGKTL